MIGAPKPEDFTMQSSGWLKSKPHRLSTRQVVATNGVWIVVFDDWPGDYDPMPAEKEHYMVEKYFGAMSEPGSKWVPMAALVLPDPVACGHCGGKGYLLFDDCYDCDGYGTFEHCSHLYDCKECDGSGAVVSDVGSKKESCWRCFGLGETKQEVAIGGHKFGAPFIRKLGRLPDAKIRVASNKESNLGLQFSLGVIKFYGGTAVLAALGG